jgi:hypothetical protein
MPAPMISVAAITLRYLVSVDLRFLLVRDLVGHEP